jgi:uncharacterized membrane protein YgdD (TMEM256/DUF423 family)
MSHLAKLFLTLGGINIALVIMFGAFDTHGLKARLAAGKYPANSN